MSLGRPKGGRVRYDGRLGGGRERSPSRAVYDSRQWRIVRKAVLARDRHTCQICGAPANTVDHIVSWREQPHLMFDPSNLRALCQPCNNREANRRRAALARMMRAQISGMPQIPDPTPGRRRTPSRLAPDPNPSAGRRTEQDPNQRQW